MIASLAGAPSLLGGILEKATGKVAKKLDESSMEESKILRKFLENKEKVNTASDIASQHSLKAFFELHDAGKDYCGLEPTLNLDGSTLWTTKKHAEQIEEERERQDSEEIERMKANKSPAPEGVCV